MPIVRAVTHLRARARVPLAVLAAAAFGCGLSEVFASAGRGDVMFVWESDTVLSNGQAILISIAVLVKGDSLQAPRIRISIPDSLTANIALNATGDSLLARSVGRDSVRVELLTSITTGEPIDTMFKLRVTGGPGGP